MSIIICLIIRGILYSTSEFNNENKPIKSIIKEYCDLNYTDNNYFMPRKWKNKNINKFAIGGENFHKTKKIDLRRLERFDWIFEIIEKIELCKKCGWIKIYKDRNYDNRTDIECIVKNFKIVIVIASHSDHFEIISAHYKRY